ncbi:MAG: RluA family pseudouridine synthase [Pseudomonadales bacterium]|nr:RluA family pseudouridine synthase [Pseudomonadales bacterium]
MNNQQQSAGVRQLDVDEESAGQRLDNYLIRVLKGVPRSRIYRIIRKGEVRVNKGRARPETRLHAGDRVRIPPIRTAAPRERVAEHYDFIEKTIIYEDDVMLIVNKPAGLAVHGGSGISLGLIEALRACQPEARHLELIHRLDRDTSGCLMIAKRRAYQRLVQEALRQRSAVDKVYLAIVHGHWPKRLTRINAPLERDVLASGERISRVTAAGKASLTDYRCLAVGGSLSLIEAKPATGRTHQIRVHCLHAGFPVAGDSKYGDREADRRLAGHGYTRMMLHAHRLSVPALGDYPAVHVEAPVDEPMTQLMEEIKGFKKNKL